MAPPAQAALAAAGMDMAAEAQADLALVANLVAHGLQQVDGMQGVAEFIAAQQQQDGGGGPGSDAGMDAGSDAGMGAGPGCESGG